MKLYVDGIGYIDVNVVGLHALPRKAVYFCSDDEFNFYVTAYDDAVYAVRIEDAYLDNGLLANAVIER